MHTSTPDMHTVSTSERPIVIGIYGLPAAGKSHLLRTLRNRLRNPQRFRFFEGSEIISDVTEGGLTAFKMMPENQKAALRVKAIGKIREECAAGGFVGIVTGHFMFWTEFEQSGHIVCTEADLATYSHIIYLETPVEIIRDRSIQDTSRNRGESTIGHLKRWQQEEKSELRQLCRTHKIIFTTVGQVRAWATQDDDRLRRLVEQICDLNEKSNEAVCKSHLDRILFNGTQPNKTKTIFILDADRTLAPEDAGKLFWKRQENRADPLKEIFGGPMGYTFAAFHQASLLYKELAWNSSEGDSLSKYKSDCHAVAHEITLYPQILKLLKDIQAVDSISVAVFTCGIADIWEDVLNMAGLGGVPVFGGGADTDFLVTPEVKAIWVKHLQDVHNYRVVAFGDSPLDVPMLKAADKAYIIVGEETKRSTTMDGAVLDAIKSSNFSAQQVLLGSHSSFRLDKVKLPVVDIATPTFLAQFLQRLPNFEHATSSPGARILATATRNAESKGPTLRQAHVRVGEFLATSFVSKILGVQSYEIPHVQGHTTEGFQLLGEADTVIVALMRGGEPMAMGINNIFSQSVFVHAKTAADLTLEHVDRCEAVILVDSVINNGGTAITFIERVRNLRGPDTMIVFVTGVVQNGAISEDRPLGSRLLSDPNLRLVALRVSQNKFTGQGPTDTGDRLFNTTRLSTNVV